MNGFPQKRIVDAGGVRLAVYEAGDAGAPPVVLVHGWPELAYSWKNQMGALAAAGWRAIAFDLKGFGASDAPAAVEAYTSLQLTADFAALLDALGIERAVFCGHDWGGALVWTMGQLHPARVAGIIGVCTPLKARSPVPPLRIIRKRMGELHYFIQFQEPGAAERLFESDVERFFKMMFRKPVPREIWSKLLPKALYLTERFSSPRAFDDDKLVMEAEDLAVYVNAYKRSGFHGGINIYRNIDRNWELMEGRDQTVRAPSLWIGADLDMALPIEAADDMETLIPDLEKQVLSKCGHWAMWERPAELNALLLDWLERRAR